MLIMLEGINGTGKSTLAAHLTERTGLPVVRPFRDTGGVHWATFGGEDSTGESEVETNLRRAGVPINTFVDNLYLADIASKMGGSLIMDRTMISAQVYGTLKGEALYEDQYLSDWIMRYWEMLIHRCSAPVVMVHLKASYKVSKARCEAEGRWHPDELEHARMAKLFDQFMKACGLPLIRVMETDDVPPAILANHILNG